MSKRSIKIEATGCHDCEMRYTERSFLTYCNFAGECLNSRKFDYIKNEIFEPHCPMTKIEVQND